MEFLDHCPSPLVAATIICAIDETPAVAFINPGIVVTWCVGLTEVNKNLNFAFKYSEEQKESLYFWRYEH